jgi:16S rRNA (guanine527-N7)-methyltransferase
MATAAGAATTEPPTTRSDDSARSAAAARPSTRARAARTIARVPATSAPFAALAREASRLGVALSAGQVSACERFARELIERNTQVNLTAITEPADIATKHFLDSFTALAARRWTGQERIVDVGSGAGFPGLALRIALRGSSAALVESVGTKARWLAEVASSLGLERVSVHNARAEALGREASHRAAYDVGTARAVGTLAECVEYLLPLLVLGGDAIVWKGKVDPELPAASRACRSVGGEISAIVPTTALGLGALLPGRHLVVVRKTRPTGSRFPRTAAEIKRAPW